MTMTANPAGEQNPGANPGDGEQTGDAALDFLIRREDEREADAEGEGDAVQADEAGDDATAQEEAQRQPGDDPELEFELDGKPVKIRKSDLPSIYRNQMLEADYRRKTAETAELTRQAAQEREAIRQEREHRVNQLDTLATALHRELVGDQSRLATLLDTDPHAYLRVKQEMERKEALLHQAAMHRHQLTQQQAADQDREFQSYLKAEQQKLQDVLPEWKDSKVRESESRQIAEMLLKHGYSQDELNTLADHRALLIARKAALWDAQQTTRKQQQGRPPQGTPAKPVPPGSRNTAPTNVRADDLRRKAMRTNNTQDILAYMTSKDS